jgi:hypothetical protein
MAVRFFPLFSIHSASCRFCSSVMNVSTKTASCLPEMSVDDIGDHLRSVTPGGKSAVTTWGWVLTNTSQCNEPFILRLRPPMTCRCAYPTQHRSSHILHCLGVSTGRPPEHLRTFRSSRSYSTCRTIHAYTDGNPSATRNQFSCWSLGFEVRPEFQRLLKIQRRCFSAPAHREVAQVGREIKNPGRPWETTRS